MESAGLCRGEASEFGEAGKVGEAGDDQEPIVAVDGEEDAPAEDRRDSQVNRERREEFHARTILIWRVGSSAGPPRTRVILGRTPRTMAMTPAVGETIGWGSAGDKEAGDDSEFQKEDTHCAHIKGAEAAVVAAADRRQGVGIEVSIDLLGPVSGCSHARGGSMERAGRVLFT